MKVIKKEVQFISKNEVKKILEKMGNTGNEDQETIKLLTMEYCNQKPGKHTNDAIIEYLEKKKLTDFEIYQLVDIRPKTLLCLQLIIEEMEERYTNDELEEILTMFE